MRAQVSYAALQWQVQDYPVANLTLTDLPDELLLNIFSFLPSTVAPNVSTDTPTHGRHGAMPGREIFILPKVCLRFYEGRPPFTCLMSSKDRSR